jgi:hypothetical protein
MEQTKLTESSEESYGSKWAVFANDDDSFLIIVVY